MKRACVLLLVLGFASAGCERDRGKEASSERQNQEEETASPRNRAPSPAPANDRIEQPPHNHPGPTREEPQSPEVVEPPSPERSNERALWPIGQPHMPEIDVDAVMALGIRRIESEHLILFTDLPPDESIDALPAIFDQAFAQWCDYFEIDAPSHAAWRMTGYLMNDAERFRRVSLFPDDLPPFLHGYQRGWELWLYEQPSDYYRRHLLLHEGTHGIMYTLLGSAGPPWYMEGIAEMLATHRLDNDQLMLNYLPKDKEEVPYWGRVKIVRDAFQAQEGMTLESILAYDARAHQRLQPYGWCWAACQFFQSHPLSAEVFADLHKEVASGSLSSTLYNELEPVWERLAEDWQLYVIHLDYGYDVARSAVEHGEGEPLPRGGIDFVLQADRGWQSSSVYMNAGETYTISASGAYQVAADPRPWISEPGGVTIRYVDGQLLGILQGALRAGFPVSGEYTPLADGLTIGKSMTITPTNSGTLYLRINDSPAELEDNSGTLTVHIERMP